MSVFVRWDTLESTVKQVVSNIGLYTAQQGKNEYLVASELKDPI